MCQLRFWKDNERAKHQQRILNNTLSPSWYTHRRRPANRPKRPNRFQVRQSRPQSVLSQPVGHQFSTVWVCELCKRMVKTIIIARLCGKGCIITSDDGITSKIWVNKRGFVFLTILLDPTFHTLSYEIRHCFQGFATYFVSWQPVVLLVNT